MDENFRSRLTQRAHPLRPLHWWAVLLGAVVAGVAATAMYLWLDRSLDLLDFSNPAERIEAVAHQIQAKHFSILAALGCVTTAILLLRFRTQIHNEREAERQHDVSQQQLGHVEKQLAQRDAELSDARFDAEQRRVLDYWSQAIDKLGHSNSFVRIAGLHLLEQVAIQHKDKQQAIIDHICAYLRQHYQPAKESEKPLQGAKQVESPIATDEERQVRLEAQRILQRHLNPIDAPAAYWSHHRLILTGAYLENLDLSRCELHGADFSQAILVGKPDFPHAVFEEGAAFVGARFPDGANFIEAAFRADPEYHATRRPGERAFVEQLRCGDFRYAEFGGEAEWAVARFHHNVTFANARFSTAGFSAVTFSKICDFSSVTFDGNFFFDVQEAWLPILKSTKVMLAAHHVLTEGFVIEPSLECDQYGLLSESPTAAP